MYGTTAKGMMLPVTSLFLCENHKHSNEDTQRSKSKDIGKCHLHKAR